GDIILKAKNIAVTDGGQIGSGTFTLGKGGSVRVTATETLKVDGFITGDVSFPSGIFATAERGSAGDAGNVIIQAGNGAITGGAVVASSATGSGNAGDILVNANEISLRNGSITTAANSGNGGNINLKIDKLLELINSQITTSVKGGL